MGEFTVAAVDPQRVTFEWHGRRVVVPISELLVAAPTSRQKKPAAERSNNRRAQAQVKTATAEQAGPGTELGRGYRACVPGDATPPGTVVEGYRKVVTKTPFGETCRWVPVE